ncbi:Ribonuclease HII, partial [hydrothermal vent metagenome]
ASAIILKEDNFISRINDSKKMTPLQREKAFDEIYQKAYVGVGIMDAAIIDQKNILQATFLAMHAAIRKLIETLPSELKNNPDFLKKICLLIDGNMFRTNLPYAYKTIIKGDSLVFSIACASIIAKVTRDRMLIEYDKTYPQYGFKQHKGYPTKKHKEALHKFGHSPIHRKTFRY